MWNLEKTWWLLKIYHWTPIFGGPSIQFKIIFQKPFQPHCTWHKYFFGIVPNHTVWQFPNISSGNFYYIHTCTLYWLVYEQSCAWRVLRLKYFQHMITSWKDLWENDVKNSFEFSAQSAQKNERKNIWNVTSSAGSKYWPICTHFAYNSWIFFWTTRSWICLVNNTELDQFLVQMKLDKFADL